MTPERNLTRSPFPRRVALSDALPLIAAGKTGALPSAAVFEHGSLQVKLYMPRGQDRQTPHVRDELYVVATGSGMFSNGTERHPFRPGDVLFVPAGTEHRFEDFSDDLLVWVVFYGPEGGERPGDRP
ncbi:MAG: cupin domain-containing protein [Betaproteobacteria bacterium]|nr:cupin domain-containing protein [Betaproteobacteria bacterium]MBL8533419.1 cupin domain-containing protein [Betaproteobacteria bacterium]